MYYKNYENYSDVESIEEEEYNNEDLDEEILFDEYLNGVKKTYDDLMIYIKYNSSNKKLLKNLTDYMFLEPLFNEKEYQFTETFEEKIERMKKLKEKNDIKIIEPINMMINFEKFNDGWETMKKNKNIQKIKKHKERSKRVKTKREKRQREEMTKRTNEILESYFL